MNLTGKIILFVLGILLLFNLSASAREDYGAITEQDCEVCHLDSYYPGVTSEEILDNMQFSVDVTKARIAEPPTEKELKILRDKCDPQRLILG